MSKIKVKKKKGPIRYEAIIPVTFFSLLTFLYFTFYFDLHLKRIFEYVGTQVNGAEVNIDSVRTSFFRGTFDVDRIQVTDPDHPEFNSVVVGSIHFDYLWDALLRMKFVVEDAGINNIQLRARRDFPGKILPLQPARPGKLDQLQLEVVSQVKNKYKSNVLGDLFELLQGERDYKSQLQQIQSELQSEKKAELMITDVKEKKELWDKKVKELSDPSRIKEVEKTIQAVQKETNLLKQAKGIKKLTDLLKDVEKQYLEVRRGSKELQEEVITISKYPQELQKEVETDVASLKNRFSLPEIDFKDMAMHLFAEQFAQYIAKARKYKAVAEQYLPEKKEEQQVVVPRARAEGKNYEFPLATGYPLFWLKKASISSEGTENSYSGNVSGVLSDVTTSPKLIKKPAVLDLQGDFPASKIMGVKALFTADFTKEIGKQSALIQVNSFPAPEKMFLEDQNLKFGFLKARGTSTISATMSENMVKMRWSSALKNPEFIVETKNKLTQQMLTNIVSAIEIIHIDGDASGTFSDLKLSLRSNLGTELAQGLKRELGTQVTAAEDQINSLIQKKIKAPQKSLNALINGSNKNLSQLKSLEELYQKNKIQFQNEIKKIKKGNVMDELKDKGKKLFKGIKL